MAQSKEEVQAIVTILEKVNSQLVLMSKNADKATKELADPKTLKDLETIEKSIDELNQSTKAFNQTKKQQATLNAKLSSLRKGEQDQIIKTKLAVQTETKAIKDRIKASKSLTPQYDKEKKRLASLQNQLAESALKTGASSKATQRLAKRVNVLNKRLSKAEQIGGRFQRNVGNYPKVMGGAILAFAAAGIGIQAFVSGISNAIGIAKDFEQSNANLAAVLGVSRSEMSELTEDAKRLGAATAFSASEVSGLQTEYAKLGFNQQEILDATEATLNLAAATGSDLGEAAAIAGATLGGFGLGAEETARVTDVMAKSFSTSALDMEKFKESMKDAAPAAKAVGVDVEKTTALLGALSNAGISGSKAGTALKAGFIELNAAGITLDESLEMIANSNNKLATATELVGKRAATSFLVLADGTEDIAALEVGLRNAGGAAEKMANEQLDTLEGSLKILNSAWEGFVLGLLSGDSAFSGVSRSIVNMTTNLLSLLTGVKDVSKTNNELVDSNLDVLKSSQENIAKNSSLVKSYEDLTSKQELNKDEREELDTVTNELIRTFGDSVAIIDEETGALTINISAIKKKIIADKVLSSNAAKDLIVQRAGFETTIETAKNAEEEFRKLRESSALPLFAENKIFDAAAKGSLELSTAIQELRTGFAKSGENSTEFENSLSVLEPRLFAISKAVLLKENAEIKLAEIDAKLLAIGVDLNALADEETEKLKDGADAADEKAKAKKGLTDAEKAYNKSLKDQISLLKEQQKEELLLAGDSELLKLDLRDEHLNQINELELKFIGKTAIEKKKINAELNNDLLANDIARVKEQQEIAEKSIEEQEKLDKKRLDDADAITQFRLDRAVKDAETINDIESTSIEAAENRAEARKRVADLSADDLILIEEQLQAEISDIQKKADADRLAEQKKADELAAKQQKELTDAALTIVETGLKKRSDARLKALDEELKASESQESKLEDLAAKGSENAVASLALAQKKEAEIRREQERELQRQKQIEAGLTAFKVFAAKTEAGDPNALGSTITDITVLQAFINSLPSAFDGTIDTGAGGNIDGKGGFLTVNHPHERTVPKVINDKMGGISNEKLGEITEMYNKGLFMDSKDLTVNNNVVERFQSNEEMLAKFDSLEEVIKGLHKNMPSNMTNWSDFYKAMIEINRRGNSIHRTRFKID